MTVAPFLVLLAILVIVWQQTVAHRELVNDPPVDSYVCVQAESNRAILPGCKSGQTGKFVAR